MIERIPLNPAEQAYVSHFAAYRRFTDGTFVAVNVRLFNVQLVTGRWLAMSYDDSW